MDSQKKKIIVAEIEYWRKSKLLPEHYCLFLLNLYQEGETIHPEVDTIRQRTPVSWKKIFGWLLSLGMVAFILFSGLTYSSEIKQYQTGMIVLGLLILYFITFWLKKRHLLVHHLLLNIVSIALLFFALWSVHSLSIDQSYLVLSVAFVMMIWFISGLILRIYYLSVISIIGLLLSYGWFMHPWLLAQPNNWMVQFVWLPLSIIGIIIGLFTIRTWIPMGRMLFFLSLFSLISPEIQSIYLDQNQNVQIQLFLILKGILMIVILFLTKKFWLAPPVERFKK